MIEITNLQAALFIGYIDPGSGSILLQFLIAGILGASYFFRNFFIRLYKKIRGLFKKDTE